MTEQEKKERREARKAEREAKKEMDRIQAERDQKPVKELTIAIEWKRSRMWGSNPRAEARVEFQDGTFERRDGYTCSGCGYDKESTVIAQIFNDFLKYKLYDKALPKRGSDKRPYGLGYYGVGNYEGGVGTSCYPSIAKFIGGKFVTVASGSTFDVFRYTDS